MPEADRESKYKAPALEKGLEILSELALAERPQTLTELAQRLGRTQGELYRMLIVLEQSGWLRRDEAERYTLTGKMLDLALRHPPVRRLLDLALPLMRRFADQHGQSCHLTLPHQGRGLVVACAESPAELITMVRPGARLELLGSSTGLCLLAFGETSLGEAVLANVAKKERAELEKQLKSIASAGHVLQPSRLINGVTDLSVPVRWSSSTPAWAALSCPCLLPPDGKVSAESLLPDLKAAANELAQAMGAHGARLW
ncbi:MAG: Transcriptional regulator KdgR [Verrucomicrobiota bacterium]|jgi:DNA-binding IclR family transcriptional regulator